MGGNNTKIANIKKTGRKIKLGATIDQKRTRQFDDCDSVEGNQLVNISIVYHTQYGQVFIYLVCFSVWKKKIQNVTKLLLLLKKIKIAH